MLENTLASVGPLRSIKDQSSQHFPHHGQELTYEQYSNLLFSEANNYDTQRSSSESQISVKAYANESYNYSFSRHSISEVTEGNIYYNIDSSDSTLLINISNQSPNTYAPKKDFSSLSPEVRKIWSKITYDMKAVMLRSRSGNCNEWLNKHSKYIHKAINSIFSS